MNKYIIREDGTRKVVDIDYIKSHNVTLIAKVASDATITNNIAKWHAQRSAARVAKSGFNPIGEKWPL